MNRFFGLMPRDCVTISKNFVDKDGSTLVIDAGPEGWTVIWGDNSGTSYQDINDTAENNFEKAYKCAVGVAGPLREITNDISEA